MKKIAFLTTIFPASKPYLKDFFYSLQNQTYKSFDIIVINDGIKDFETIRKKYSDLNIIEFKVNFTPAKNREFGINKTIELGYEYIIFGDSDDFFAKNRFKVIIELLKTNDIVINDLNILCKTEIKSNFLSNIIKKEKLNINYFFDQNIAGLSNIAIKTSLLKNSNIKFNNELIAVDWYFFTTLLLQNPTANVYFTKKTSTYYRQYEQNTIGLNYTINSEKIKLGINVKLSHYKNLINFCNKNQISNFDSTFEIKYKEIQKLKTKIKNKSFFEKYILVIENNFDAIFKGWWSEIITIKEFEQYENRTNR